MRSELGRKVLDVLENEGPQLPIVVLARLLNVLPSLLVDVLDDLYDAGLVKPGRERGTVELVPQRPERDRRFSRGKRGRSRTPGTRG